MKKTVLRLLAGCFLSLGAQAEVVLDEAAYQGPYTNDVIEYNFTDLNEHSRVSVDFDLWVYDSWDGANPNTLEGDLFIVEIDGTQYNWSFDYRMRTVRELSSDTDYVTGEFNEIDRYDGLDRYYDSFFDGLVFGHYASNLNVKIYGLGLSGPQDESWAIENLMVSTGNAQTLGEWSNLVDYTDVPVPFSALGMFGLAGLFFKSRKRA